MSIIARATAGDWVFAIEHIEEGALDIDNSSPEGWVLHQTNEAADEYDRLTMGDEDHFATCDGEPLPDRLTKALKRSAATGKPVAMRMTDAEVDTMLDAMPCQ